VWFTLILDHGNKIIQTYVSSMSHSLECKIDLLYNKPESLANCLAGIKYLPLNLSFYQYKENCKTALFPVVKFPYFGCAVEYQIA